MFMLASGDGMYVIVCDVKAALVCMITIQLNNSCFAIFYQMEIKQQDLQKITWRD
jgi:hypothetical protein